jgi:hypothetical protein
MSGGIAVQDGSHGGGSPRLHKRSAETWGDRGWSRRESLTAWGPQAPLLIFRFSQEFPQPSHRDDSFPRVKDSQGAQPCAGLLSAVPSDSGVRSSLPRNETRQPTCLHVCHNDKL